MFDLVFLVVAGTSLWVLFDANSIGVRKGQIKGFFDMGIAGWFFSCLLMWIVAFPAYLAKRNEYKLRPATSGQLGGIQVPDVPSQIGQLAELKAHGILTDEEFQVKKTELLSRM
jgi:Short C-terminal domain